LRLGIHLAAIALVGAAGAINCAAKEPAPAKETSPAKESAPAKETAPAKESGSAAAPIDTRIGVLPVLKKSPGAVEKKATGPAGPSSVNSARQGSPHDVTGVTRNAIGVPVDARVTAKGISPGAQDHAPNAIGMPKNPAGGPMANQMGNHMGTVTIARPSFGAAAMRGPVSGPIPQNRAVITGTGMNRPGSGPGTVGGAARNTTAINGTVIRPKH
jgi:hypothetical protein